jgi:hypothetical protein
MTIMTLTGEQSPCTVASEGTIPAGGGREAARCDDVTRG